MATINQLSAASTVSAGDLLPIYSSNNGDARKLSISALLAYFQQTFASPSVATTVYVPTTGFNIGVPTPVSQQQWLILQPISTLAAGTITLPLNTSTPDGMEVLITTTQQITAFTLGLNGAAAAFGDPATLAADDFFRMRFVQSTNSWYRIA